MANSPGSSTSSSHEDQDTRKRRRPQSALQAAITEGLVPKARKPFALFTQSKATNNGGRLCWKAIGAEWRSLSKEGRKHWADQSAAEFSTQRQAALTTGLSIRSSLSTCNDLVAPESLGPVATSRRHEENNLPATDSMFFGHFKLEQQLGQGTFGKVISAADSGTGQRVALKVFMDTRNQDLLRELAMYEAIGAPGSSAATSQLFLRVIDYSATGAFQWLCLEHGPASLHQLIKSQGALQAPDVDSVARQLFAALGHLHILGLAHLDIKPRNVLWRVSTRSLLLIDMGMAERVPVAEGQELMFNTYVTTLYRPPELWATRPPFVYQVLGFPVDVWAAGATVYEAGTAKALFKPLVTNRFTDHDVLEAVRGWCSVHQTLSQSTDSTGTRAIFRARLVCLPPQLKLRQLVSLCCSPQPTARPQPNSAGHYSHLWTQPWGS
jgi:serine/threonine protein kinase